MDHKKTLLEKIPKQFLAAAAKKNQKKKQLFATDAKNSPTVVCEMPQDQSPDKYNI